MHINKKVALITGASRGIGAETAKLFAQHGYAVCINYHQDVLAAQSVEREIIEAGGDCLLVQADISDSLQVAKLFAQVKEKLGVISVLVNNAGILQPQTKITELTPERINTIFKVNVTDSFLCCIEAVKHMAYNHHGQGGAIINVSSMAAITGSPNEYIDYAASKGALDTLTKGLAKEVATEGIRVNAVRPGLIYTQMHKDGGEAHRVDRLKAKIPLGRGGQPLEVAQAIYWLASDAASFTTGSFIDVAGGM